VQSNKQQIMEHVLAPIMSFYSPPRAMEDKEGAIGLYLKALAPYPLAALQGAMVRVIAEHDRSTWPLPSEIIKAARDWIHTNVKPEPNATPARVDGFRDRRKYTDRCPEWMRSKLGQQALAEGWARILWDEIEIKGQCEKSADAMRALDLEMRDKIAQMKARPNEWMACVTSMGVNRLAKESELRAEYLAKLTPC
jgi:hypothetical protein